MSHYRLVTFRLLIAVLGIGMLVLALPVGASPTGGTYIVTRLDDPVPDGCQPADCSLREAVTAANGATGGTITFQANGTVALTLGQLVVTTEITIAGNSAISNTIAGNGAARLFYADGTAPTPCALNLHNVTLTGGMTDGQGGGVLAESDCEVLLSSVVIHNNEATDGGGVAKIGTTEGITIRNSAIISNSATNGGGVAVLNGSAILNNVTLSGNNAESKGGGLYVLTTNGGGALLQSVTIANNSATIADGIAFEESTSPQEGFVRPFNTIVADTATSACATIGFDTLTFESIGFNIATDGSCNLTGLADFPNQNPQLGALRWDSGTYIHVPALTGPAIDSGASGVITTDQRGLPRPVDLPAFPNANDGADRGAYEHQSGTPTAITLMEFRATPSATGAVLLFLLITVIGIEWYGWKGR